MNGWIWAKDQTGAKYIIISMDVLNSKDIKMISYMIWPNFLTQRKQIKFFELHTDSGVDKHFSFSNWQI